MSWGIMVAAAAGAIAGGLASLVRGEDKKALRAIVAAIAFVGLNAAGREYVVKPHEADVALLNIDAFRVIKEREPEAYAAIRADILVTIRGGADTTAVQARVHGHIAPLAKKYIPRASDAALRRYITVTVAEIDQLRKRNPALAKSFLFPTPGEFVNIQPYLDDATMKEDVAALGQVIETGAGSQARPVDDKRADELLQGALARVAAKYGQDFALLAKPSSPNTDAGKVTAIVADLYREILALPAPDSAMVLRKMLSGA